MQKPSIKRFQLALNKLALVAFITMNVAPAFANWNSTVLPYVPLPPGQLYDPAIILESQAALNIYGPSGSIGQLPAGSVFEAQMARDPFHAALVANTFDYNALLRSALQSPTSYGPMVSATAIEPIMFDNGMTLPASSNFYIPPADFNYAKIHAIGARSETTDEDIDLLYERVLSNSRSYNLNEFDSDDDEDRDFDSQSDNDSDKDSAREKRKNRTKDLTQKLRASEVGYYSVPISDEKVVVQAVSSTPNEPFKIAGPTCDCRSSTGKACTLSPNFGQKRKTHKHEGVDISGGTGAPIVAAADGVVTVAYRSASYGNTLDIRHSGNYMTRYAHLKAMPIVKPGQRVKRGQIIGYMGSTGRSSGPHLHFEVCKLKKGQSRCQTGNVLNPYSFMSNNQNSQLNNSCNTLAGSTSQPSTPPTSGTSVPGRTSRTTR